MQHANDNGPLGRIYTLDEAAEELRVSRRSLQEIIKRHPFFAKNGRVYLFSESDIRSIWEGMRFHSDLSNEKVRTIGTSVARSENRVYSKARELTTGRPQRQSVLSVRLAS
jgi:Helix-turn-helix domain